MSSSTIDPLLQIPAPPRAGGGPSRGEQTPAFDPALRLAIDEQRPAETHRPRESTKDSQPPQDHDARNAPEDVADVDGSALDDEAEETTEPAADEVVISAAAVATANAPPAAEEAAIADPSAILALKTGADAKSGDDSPAPTPADAEGDEASDAPAPTAANPAPAPDENAAKTEAPAGEVTETPKAEKPAAVNHALPESRPAAPTRQHALPADSGEGADVAVESTSETSAASATDDTTAPTADQSRPQEVARPEVKQPATAASADAPPPLAANAASPLDATAHREAPAPEASAKPMAEIGPAAPSASPSAAVDRLSAARSLHPATATTDLDAAPHVDRARFVQRVEGAMRRAQDHEGRVQVRLSPPELGSLRIELTVQHGVMSARLEAETATARNLLLDNLPALRERLAQQDIRVEKFDVDVRRDGGDGGGHADDGGPRDRAADRPAERSRHGRSRTEASASPAIPVGRINSTPAKPDAGLDVCV